MSSLVIKLARAGAESVASMNAHDVRKIERILGQFGVALTESSQLALKSSDYVNIEGVAPEHLDELRSALARLRGIEAAYVKPADELP